MANTPLLNGCGGNTNGESLNFDSRRINEIAQKVATLVVAHLKSTKPSLTIHKFPGCKLEGLRLCQFERFCTIVEEKPFMLPYHAAQQALADLPGEGGFTRASTLQRYASTHQKFWKKEG